MILPCGCDSIYTDFFDRCAPCRERLSIEADILTKREKERPPVGSDRVVGPGGQIGYMDAQSYDIPWWEEI